jgi:hypothetical protein
MHNIDTPELPETVKSARDEFLKTVEGAYEFEQAS